MKTYDIRIANLLESDRFRGDFREFIHRELGYEWDGTPLSKLQFLEVLRTKKDEPWDLKKSDPIFEMEMKLLPILTEMELQGVRMDKKKLLEIGREIADKIKNLELEIYDVVGDRFNIASPKQIQELFQKLGIPLTKKNKTGYSVDTEVLEEIAKTYDIARLILEHRLLSKLQSTYIDGLSKEIDDSERIHTTYNQIGASTGRMSSTDPNLQNIPTGSGYGQDIKSCFIPSTKDHILITADYSQIEIRVLAFLSGDAELIDTFDRREDIHMRTARFLFGDGVQITSERRRVAKTVNFWVIYGITGFGLAKSLDTTPAEANRYIEAFYKEYPGVRAYYDSLLAEARVSGYVQTYYGRKRYIPGLADANRMMRTAAEREAINMPIQGTAADILKLAMIDIDAKIRENKLRGKMILQVHDELVFDIPREEEEAFIHLIRKSMEWVLVDSPIDLLVDIHSGENWASAKG